MPIFVVNHRISQKQIYQRYGQVTILDMTSRGEEPWIRFSPFYPHGNIPVPFSPMHVSASVEGIWQGLKVFESMGVDPTRFTITSMKGIKRSGKKYGRILGHQDGVDGERLLSYIEARRAIYLPSYYWVLTHNLQDLLKRLSQMEQEQPLVFLDYETNCDIENVAHPLSHAGLIKCYQEGNWPTEDGKSLQQ